MKKRQKLAIQKSKFQKENREELRHIVNEVRKIKTLLESLEELKKKRELKNEQSCLFGSDLFDGRHAYLDPDIQLNLF